MYCLQAVLLKVEAMLCLLPPEQLMAKAASVLCVHRKSSKRTALINYPVDSSVNSIRYE